MSESSPAPTLTIPDFDPEDLEVADLFLGSELRPTVVPGAPAMIIVELDPDDLSYVFVNIDPPGEPLVASRLTSSPPCVAAGGSVSDAAAGVGIRPSTAKRHLADLRAVGGMTVWA